MTLRKRIALLVCGAVIFLLVAPALILAARGYWFDFAARKLVKTGTLVVKTDPRGASVFLNGESRGATPLTKRFLFPGEYALDVLKPGFYPWKKTISVNPQRLTFLPSHGAKIFLLRQNPEKFVSATTTPPVLPRGDNSLSGQYYIAPTTNDLLFRQSGQSEAETILQNLPKSGSSQIIVSPMRQIFLLLDATLYQVGEDLNKINDRVTYAGWNKDAEALLYGNEHEIWLYRAETGSPNELITRVSEAISEAKFASQIGYFFYSSQGKIAALEYDPRLSPNLYTVAETKSPQVPFWLNATATELSYYDSGELVTLKIR